jgi:hypothetical protein
MSARSIGLGGERHPQRHVAEPKYSPMRKLTT